MAEVTPEAAQAHFWTLAEPFLAREGVDKGTLMGFPCIRYAEKFVACPQHKDTALIAKLPKSRVAGLIAAGEGESFAPAKRVFKEWVRVPWAQRESWTARLEEAFAFAGLE